MNTAIAFAQSNPTVAWLIVGTLCLIVEVLVTWGFFLSFAASAYGVALLSWLGVLPSSLIVVATIWAAVGVALILPIKRLLRRYSDRQPDINAY